MSAPVPDESLPFDLLTSKAFSCIMLEADNPKSGEEEKWLKEQS